MTSDGQGSSYDVVVIGASQAGLAMGYYLAQKSLSFVILDAGPEIGHLWRSRWDSLVLFTPAQYSGLPGKAFPAPEDTYPTKDDVVSYLQWRRVLFRCPSLPLSPPSSTNRCFRSTAPTTAIRLRFHKGKSWSWGEATPASRSPRS